MPLFLLGEWSARKRKDTMEVVPREGLVRWCGVLMGIIKA
jgi:hypothetical protein